VAALLRELGMESSLKLRLLAARWEALFPGSLSLHTSPSVLKDGELLVSVDSPAWLQEISFHRAVMLEKLKDCGIRQVRFRLGAVRKPTRPEPRREGRLSEEHRLLIEEVVSGVSDPELAGRIRGAMRNWALRRGRP